MSIFPTKILLATDGSEEAELALNTAVDIAAKTDSELHVVHVGHLLSSYIATAAMGRGPLPGSQEELDREARRLLDAQVEKIRAVGGIVARTHLWSSERPETEIVSMAEEIGAGLIVMGRRGEGS